MPGFRVPRTIIVLFILSRLSVFPICSELYPGSTWVSLYSSAFIAPVMARDRVLVECRPRPQRACNFCGISKRCDGVLVLAWHNCTRCRAHTAGGMKRDIAEHHSPTITAAELSLSTQVGLVPREGIVPCIRTNLRRRMLDEPFPESALG